VRAPSANCNRLSALLPLHDPNPWKLIEVGREQNNWRSLNESLVEWSAHATKLYIYG